MSTRWRGWLAGPTCSPPSSSSSPSSRRTGVQWTLSTSSSWYPPTPHTLKSSHPCITSSHYIISNLNITPGLGKEWAWSPSLLFWPPWAKRPGSWVFQLWSVDYVLSSLTYISSFTSLSFTPILPFLKGHFQVLYRLHQHRDILSKEGGRTGLKYLSIVSILIITSQLWVF